MRRAASLDTYTFEFELTFIELRNDDLRCLFANTLRYSRPVTTEPGPRAPLCLRVPGPLHAASTGLALVHIGAMPDQRVTGTRCVSVS